jgi:hypothetical protein
MKKYALINKEGIVTEIKEFDIHAADDTTEFRLAVSLDTIPEPTVGQMWDGLNNQFITIP